MSEINTQVSSENEWTTVIKPKDKLLAVDFAELWRYRDLCAMFIKRNTTTQYKQTIHKLLCKNLDQNFLLPKLLLKF